MTSSDSTSAQRRAETAEARVRELTDKLEAEMAEHRRIVVLMAEEGWDGGVGGYDSASVSIDLCILHVN
jgi:hypothetical protein